MVSSMVVANLKLKSSKKYLFGRKRGGLLFARFGDLEFVVLDISQDLSILLGC